MKTCLVLLVSLLGAVISVGQNRSVVNTSSSPYARLRSIEFDDCRWTEGFWFDRQQVGVETMIPHLGELMDAPEIIHAYDNFLVAAGLQEGEFRGWSFHDGDFYKYVEALCYQYDLTGDPAIDAKLDEIIRVIGLAQEDDGYLHTMIQIGHGISGPHHSSEKTFTEAGGRFETGGKHEFYNYGHLFTAACIHYRITGKTSFLDIARKAADLLYRTFQRPSRELATVAWNPPHYMGLVELYRTTGDRRYLELTDTFLTMRGTERSVKGAHRGLDHSQKRTPFREEREAVGHAGHGNYLYSGVTDLYAETGESALRDSLEAIWTNVTTGKMYVTGATGPNHYGLSDNHDLVSEAYGQNFELPNIRAYNETCANIGHAMWNWRMFQLEGDARFADLVELVFYNSAPSGISLDGRTYFYTNPMRYLEGHPQNTKDEGQRNPFMSVFCCPPNIIRTIAKMHTYAYSTSDEGVWVNLYGANRLDTQLANGERLRLSQATDYPWAGVVRLTVEEAPSAEMALRLRIPGWAQGATVVVNGVAVDGQLESGRYHRISRTWVAGDVVELDLPMDTRLIAGDPWVESVRNQVAVKRGPLVYCLESVDLPASIRLTDVVIPRDIDWQPHEGTGVLSGITLLEGEARAMPRGVSVDKLYRPVPSAPLRKARISLIPYYAWSNRGKTDMSVWLPITY